MLFRSRFCIDQDLCIAVVSLMPNGTMDLGRCCRWLARARMMRSLCLLQSHGQVGLSGETVVVRQETNEVERIPLPLLDQILVMEIFSSQPH